MDNIKRIQQELQPAGCDAIMLSNPFNRFFASGFMSSAGIVLVAEDNAWLFVDSRYEEAARLAVKNTEVVLIAKHEELLEQLCERINRYGINTLGFEDKTLIYADYQNCSEKLPVELVPASKLVEKLRAVKSRDELNQMIRAQRIAEKSYEEVLPVISTDITEKELAAELVYRFMKNGADDKSFDPIIVSAERSSMPHGVPGDNKIKKGFLTIDFGVRLGTWCSDTTRTLCVGKPTDEMVKVYNTVLAAQEAGISYARAGVKGCDIDAAARKIIDDAGFGKYFGHGFGHGLGLEVHETPNASPSFKEELPSGAVISAEPGIYIPGQFGVRIEDVIYITDDGCENITNLKKNLIIL